MVLQRTLNNLRERPKEERTAIAAWIAIGVVALLFAGWLIFFFNSIRTSPAPDLQQIGSSLDQNGLSQADQQFEQAYGSSTQFVEAQGTMELEPIGTSTGSSQ
jgi:hypothetical protein